MRLYDLVATAIRRCEARGILLTLGPFGDFRSELHDLSGQWEIQEPTAGARPFANAIDCVLIHAQPGGPPDHFTAAARALGVSRDEMEAFLDGADGQAMGGPAGHGPPRAVIDAYQAGAVLRWQRMARCACGTPHMDYEPCPGCEEAASAR